MRAMSPQVLVSAQHARCLEEGLGQEAVVDKGRGHRAKGILCALLTLCPLLYALCPVSAGAAGGTIKGRVTFTGKEPGNRVIRMGMDPMCAAATRGKQVVNEIYAVGDNNSLGNVFVKLEGTFPATPVPSAPERSINA